MASRPPVTLAVIMQRGSKMELAAVLRMRAVDHEAKPLYPAPRVAVEQHGPHGLAVDRRDLLAPAQIRNRGIPMLCRGPVGDAAAGAAAVEPPNQARPPRRAATDAAEHAQRAVC